MTAILGAGISGLSAAYYALENPKLSSIVIFEATNRVGGWIRSRYQPDGTIFEQGPRTIRPIGESGKNTLKLIEELGLSDKVIPIRSFHPAAQNRLVYENNQIHLLSMNLRNIFKKNTLLNRTLFSILWKELWTSRVHKDDESVYSFIERRFGQEVAEKIICPLVCGICAGDAHNISIKSLMKSLFEAEQKHGSVVKSYLLNLKEHTREKSNQVITEPLAETLTQKANKEIWIFYTLNGGLEQLPKVLANNVAKRGINIKMKHKCEQLRFNKDHVELTVKGNIQKYSYIISSLPAKSLADLVQEQHPELSTELRGIPTVTVGIVNLQFSRNVLPMNAFGLLVPPKEEIPILGIIFDSCIYPRSSKTVLTVMMGGAWFEKYFGECSSEKYLLHVAVSQVREILHIKEDPEAFNVSILEDCIPQHIVGHMQRLTRIHNYISTHKIPLGLCGSSYQGVGLNDVILSAKEAVSNINFNV